MTNTMSTDEVSGVVVADINKPFRFEDVHFKRSKQKILFFLTMKKVASALTSQKPVVVETTELWEKEKQTKALQDWTENDFMCKNFLLNGLLDDLYDYYNSDDVTTHKLWEALQKKYDTEEAGTKKYAVSRYMKLQMTNDKLVEAQSHELQKAQNKRIFFIKFNHSPRIEEEARKQDQKDEVLVVFSNNNNTNKRSTAVLKPKGKNFKNQNHKLTQNRIYQPRNNQHYWNPQRNQYKKQQPHIKNDSDVFTCYNCGKPGHMAHKCRNRPNTTPSANLIEELPLIAMISEINLIGGSEGWWVDYGATIHVCYDRSLFKTYTAASEDKKVLLGDHHTTNVAGIRNVELKFKSGKSSDPQRCYAHS
ncbi:retrovirus-related pol polyprotein from transposon TNT 1-94 [Tanacetum coccineum]